MKGAKHRGKLLGALVRETVEDVAGEILDRGESFAYDLLSRRRADNPYSVLGVSPDDPIEVIRAVHNAKSRVLHPDNKETGDDAKFKKMQQAYEEIIRARG